VEKSSYTATTLNMQ